MAENEEIFRLNSTLRQGHKLPGGEFRFSDSTHCYRCVDIVFHDVISQTVRYGEATPARNDYCGAARFSGIRTMHEQFPSPGIMHYSSHSRHEISIVFEHLEEIFELGGVASMTSIDYSLSQPSTFLRRRSSPLC